MYLHKFLRVSGACAFLICVTAVSPGFADGDIGSHLWDKDLSVLKLDDQLEQCSCCDDCCGCCDDCCGCGDGCCDCGSGCCRGRLFGLFAPSQAGFDDFISPITNPVFFEDPRTLTEARFFYLRHEVPTAVGGGLVQLWALQLRAALTERLSIVAAKDGFATSSHPIIDDGWADLSVGLKYNLLVDRAAQRILSTGFAYELPTGEASLAQGNGDGEFQIYLTGGTQLFDFMHWISASGFRLPTDPGDGSRMWYWSNHWDAQLTKKWYVLSELNWYNWIGAGDDNLGLTGIEGLDLFNFGSAGVAGNDIVTNGYGVKCKPSRNCEIGLVYEFPLTDRRDIIENRMTFDVILRY